MANRRFNNQQFTMTPGCVSIFAHCTFGSSGAVTLDAANSKGVVSVTHDDTGQYTFTFGTSATSLDTYNRLLCISQTFYAASGHPGQDVFVTSNDISDPTLASLSLEFDTAGSATDPASGVEVFLRFDFKNSSAP